MNTKLTQVKNRLATATAALGLAALALVANPASAALIYVDNATPLNSSYDISWAFEAPGQGVTLTAEATYSLSAFSSSQVNFDISISNTMSTSLNTQVITSFGFDTNPALTGASITGGNYFESVAVNPSPNIPGGFTVDLCVWTGNNCASGPQPSGLPNGQTDNFTLSLLGDFSNGLELSEFPLRMIGAYDSWVFVPTNGDDPEDPPTGVSEPGVLFLLGAGLIALAWTRRRHEAV